MIIPLVEALNINENITKSELDGFEVAIRRLTNNNFQNKNVRFKNIVVVADNQIKLRTPPLGLRVGDTVEINDSKYNDGLYVITGILGSFITVEENRLHIVNAADAMLTKVEYPADIAVNVKKMIEYDKKMSSKLGIKSETISRMSTTYYDVNATENKDGYPISMLSFLEKYEKMRW